MNFHPKELESYLPYTKAMREFMSKYDEENQKDSMKFDDCGSKVSMKTFFSRFSLSLTVCLLSLQWNQMTTGTEATWTVQRALRRPASSPESCWDPAQALKTETLVLVRASPV